LKQAYNSIIESINASDWSTPSIKQSISMSTRSQPNTSLLATKGVGIVNLEASVIHQLFSNPEYRSLYDPLYDSGRIHQSIDRLTHIKFTQFKAPWPVSKREVLSINRSTRLSDGSILDYATSIDLDDLPVTNGYVRAQLKYYGLLIKPINQPSNQSDSQSDSQSNSQSNDQTNSQSNSQSCEVTYIQLSDPMGDLPQRLVNATSSDKALAISVIDGLIETNPAIVSQARQEIEQKIKAYQDSQTN
jgi:hypothetical protein